MNYQKARQLESTKKWHYTSENNGRIHPIGYCANHEGHETAEEAQACYKGYLLDNNLLLDGKWEGQLSKCQVCGEWTDGMASIPWNQWYVTLCDTHRNRGEVERLFTVGESWQS